MRTKSIETTLSINRRYLKTEKNNQKIKLKSKELQIAQENQQLSSAKTNISRKNLEEEDSFLKNYIQNSLRQEAVNQNAISNKNKRKEMEVLEFNKNLMLTKNKQISGFKIQSKEGDSYRYKQEDQNGEVMVDPFLEGGEKRKREMESKFDKLKKSKEHQEAQILMERNVSRSEIVLRF